MRVAKSLAALFGLSVSACAPRDEAPPSVSAAAVPPPLRAKAESCLVGERFTLAGVPLHASDSARATLGMPIAVVRGMTEDDGGGTALTTYRYASVALDIVRGRVDRLLTRDADVVGPVGLRVGISRDSALARLAAAGLLRTAERGTIEAPHCDGDSHLVLTIGADGRVTTVEAVAERP